MSQYIAMNRFRVLKGSEAEFEQVWLSREVHLHELPGFVEFHLLRGPETDEHTLYASHTVWRSKADFEAWTRSEAFRAAHRNAGDRKPLYAGPPQFEGFEVLQTVLGDGTRVNANQAAG
ncbi:heme-degrading monooxygenase HmoA [Pseudochelatococcus lubricantis]|uniref:Heme-degrading monooxygenase HmoA n=1 Tax=Pseudochelatococcus lubricantis TaxID=1538102 RepID=A0ABX0UYR9_9HYPH|nr:antibiotic biosynthesis monooxygenase [Pseudochelatococcus lubricantis]NIJ57030.1 heme-degrading monooxygenase HmoA [Pseudochelatococcus lubricantis]